MLLGRNYYRSHVYLAHWACSHSWSTGFIYVVQLGLGYTCLLAFCAGVCSNELLDGVRSGYQPYRRFRLGAQVGLNNIVWFSVIICAITYECECKPRPDCEKGGVSEIQL